MARIINFEGRRITVPDDATDEEVAGIIGGSAPAAPAAPVAPAFTQVVPPAPQAPFDPMQALLAKTQPETNAPFHTVPEDQRGYEPLGAAMQGAARTGADLLGLPFDVPAAIGNVPLWLWNKGGNAGQFLRGEPIKDSVPYFNGASDVIANKASEVAESAGFPVQDYEQMDPRSKTAYQATRFGLGGLLQSLALRGGSVLRGESDMPRFGDKLLKPYEGPDAASVIARDTAGGVGTGVGLAAVDSALPEDERGVGWSLLAGLVGGVGGQTAFDVGTKGPTKVGSFLTRGMADPNLPFNPDGSFVSRGASRDAAKFYQGEAERGQMRPRGDASREAADTIQRNVDELLAIGAPIPPTGQISGNVGLARVERGVAVEGAGANAIHDRNMAVDQYASDQIKNMAPNGDPTLFPKAAESIAESATAPARTEAAYLESGAGLAAQQRQAEAAQLADEAARGKVPASQALDREITGDMAALREQRATALDSRTIDPEGAVRLPGDPLYAAADRALEIGAELPESLRNRIRPGQAVAGDLADRRPREVIEESPILGENGRPLQKVRVEGDETLSLAELNDLRPKLAALSRTYDRAAGNGDATAIEKRQAVDTLRNEINTQLRGYADNAGTPEAARLSEGLALGDEFNARYRDPGPGDPVVKLREDIQKERGDMTGRTTTPPEKTAARFIQEDEKGGVSSAAALNRAMETASNPAAIAAARRDFIIGEAAGQIMTNGAVDPAKVRVFQNKWRGVLDQSPETATALEDIARRAQRGEQMEGSIADQLSSAQNRMRGTEAEIADSALSVVAGKSPTKAVQGILSHKNPPEAMSDLMKRMEGVRGGQDSVKRALAEEIYSKVTNTRELESGGHAVNRSGLVRLDKNADFDGVLAAAYKDDPDAMQALQRARRVLSSRQFLEDAKGTAGSATASNLQGVFRFVELGLRATQGGFKGGNTARNIRVGLGGLLKGRDNEVQQLIARAQVDPRVAKTLLSKEIAEDPSAWASKMRKILNWEEAARQGSEPEELPLGGK